MIQKLKEMSTRPSRDLTYTTVRNLSDHLHFDSQLSFSPEKIEQFFYNSIEQLVNFKEPILSTDIFLSQGK